MPESLFNEVVGLRPATLLKARHWHRCFLVNFMKFPKTPFLQNTPCGCSFVYWINDCEKLWRWSHLEKRLSRHLLVNYFIKIICHHQNNIIYGNFVCKTLEININACLTEVVFIRFLEKCSKVFYTMFCLIIFLGNGHISFNQSSFKSGAPCIKLVIPKAHKKSKCVARDYYRRYGISCNSLKFLEKFYNKRQRVVLNGPCSLEWFKSIWWFNKVRF